MTDETIVSIKNITKVFKFPHERLFTAKQHFVNLFSRKALRKFTALEDISFEIKKGEFFGIIGSNGSGKSTLLKILAGIYQPTEGKIKIKGSLSPFIELGVGFNPELTARDNVYLNAAILGLARKETEKKFNEIVEFSELENFMDQKLKNFSSGMQVRLAFSIAIHAQADILLIDEVLAVGDVAFQQKCFEVFRNLKKQSKTVIFVSHDLGTIAEFCDEVALINKSKLLKIGKPREVITEYLKIVEETENLSPQSKEEIKEEFREVQEEDKEKEGIFVDEKSLEITKRFEDLELQISTLTEEIKRKEAEVGGIYDSRAWKLATKIKKIKRIIDLSALAVKKPNKIKKAFSYLLKDGTIGFKDRLKTSLLQEEYGDKYLIWLKSNYPTNGQLKKEFQESNSFKYQPKISLITPVFNTPPHLLKECIESVINQSYPNFEMCLIDDCSTDKDLVDLIKKYSSKDGRIKYEVRKKNGGIALASNDALKLATGEYVGFLDSDDFLWPNALYEIVKKLNANKDLDLFYSDEDKIDESGEVHKDAFFKPDWNESLFFSMNYLNHFTVIRRSLVQSLGGFREKYTGSQDYDLLLRVIEKTSKIHHIAKILYSWRMIKGSTALEGSAKGYATDNAVLALEDYLSRKKIQAKVERTKLLGRYRIKYSIKEKPEVTIAILTGGKINLLKKCLLSILEKSTYEKYKILVVDNSLNPITEEFLRGIKKKYKGKIDFYEDRLKPFNFPALYNKAFERITSPFAILLNDDIEVVTPSWIEAMLEYSQQTNEVGLVGCKLLYPDGAIQHAGVVMGIYNNSGHGFKGVHNDVDFYFSLPHVVREVTAVTFACVMVRTSLYKEVGGLDAETFKVAFNDVDFCLKVRKRGLKVIYTPFSVLIHHESVTKSVHMLPGEVDSMRNRWTKEIAQDPYYNPNLTRTTEDYQVKLDY